MSDEVMERGCEAYGNELAELALGVLTGRDRARVLSHVESCQRCADELEMLSRVADTVVQAAPEMDPPLGFEVRLFERMGVTDVSRRRRRFRPSRWVPAVVGVAAAALALGLGLSLTSSSPSPTVSAQAGRRAGAEHVETASLMAHGQTVGQVEDVRRSPALDLDDAGGFDRERESGLRGRDQGRCHPSRRDLRGRRRVRGVGRPAYHVNPADVRTAQVVSPSGTVIATATLG